MVGWPFVRARYARPHCGPANQPSPGDCLTKVRNLTDTTYTLPQLFAILVLRQFLKTDYRGVVALLSEWSDLRRVLKLSKVPDHSTLWYVEQSLAKKGFSIGCSPPALRMLNGSV